MSGPPASAPPQSTPTFDLYSTATGPHAVPRFSLPSLFPVTPSESPVRCRPAPPPLSRMPSELPGRGVLFQPRPRAGVGPHGSAWLLFQVSSRFPRLKCIWSLMPPPSDRWGVSQTGLPSLRWTPAAATGVAETAHCESPPAGGPCRGSRSLAGLSTSLTDTVEAHPRWLGAACWFSGETAGETVHQSPASGPPPSRSGGCQPGGSKSHPDKPACLPCVFSEWSWPPKHTGSLFRFPTEERGGDGPDDREPVLWDPVTGEFGSRQRVHP